MSQCYRRVHRLRSFRHFVALLVLPWSSCLGSDAGGNLLRNGDFEQIENGKPAFWRLDERPNSATISLDKGRDGGHSLRLEAKEFKEGWIIVCQDNTVMVEAGRHYRLTFWHRAQNLSKPVEGARVALYRIEPWTNAGLRDTTFIPGREWARTTISFTASQTCSNTRLEFWLCQTGILWLDDVSLVLAEDEELPAVLLPRAGVANLVPNSSFELGGVGWATLGWDTLLGQLDSTTAADGSKSWRFELAPGKYPEFWQDWPDPQHNPVYDLGLANLGWLEMTKGKPFTFSAALKSDPPGLPVRMWVHGIHGAIAAHEVRASGEWRRESFTFTPTRNFGFVVVQPLIAKPQEQRATLWVDAVRLTEGANIGDFAPRRPVEVGLSTPVTANIFDLGNPPRLLVDMFRWRDEPATLKIAVTDFDNRPIWQQRFPLQGRVGEKQRFTVEPKLPGTGFYRAEWLVQGQGWREEGRMRFAVIFPWLARFAKAEAFFGMNHPYPSDLRMWLARRCGIGWTRDWSLGWDVVEKEKGLFDWTAAREVIQRDLQFGFHVQACLGHPSSRWASSADAQAKTHTGEGEPAYRWFAPRNMDDWENYVFNVVKEWKNIIRHYEILNEPWWKYPGGKEMTAEEYVAFARHGFIAAKRADPGCTVIAGQGGSPADDKRYGDLYAAGLLQWCDAVCFHPYGEFSQKSFDGMFRLMEKHGGRKPVWNTEYAIWADEDPDPTTAQNYLAFRGSNAESLAAEAIVRHHTRMLSAGFRGNMQHIHHWPLRANTETLPFDMLFEYGGLPRKTYVAMNVQAWLIPPGSVPAGHGGDDDGISVYVFRHGGRRIAVIWAARDTLLTPSQRGVLARRGSRLFNIMGNPIPPPATLTTRPIYVETDASGAVSLLRTLGGSKASPIS